MALFELSLWFSPKNTPAQCMKEIDAFCGIANVRVLSTVQIAAIAQL